MSIQLHKLRIESLLVILITINTVLLVTLSKTSGNVCLAKSTVSFHIRKNTSSIHSKKILDNEHKVRSIVLGNPTLLSIRAGGDNTSKSSSSSSSNNSSYSRRRSSGSGKRSTLKKKRKRGSSTLQSNQPKEKSDNLETSKNVIKDALKEDIAIAMGDAIRSRSSDLLNDDLSHPYPMNHGDMTLHSISYAIGSSERLQQPKSQGTMSSSHILNDGGSVEPSSSAVIANYFLKSHGGLHGIQSIMSILSVLFGLGSFAIPVQNNVNLKIRLIQRTLVCALAKHISGFMAAATASASQIPDVGWRETRVRIQSFALDPVAQYLFYCALLILWMNGVVSSNSSSSSSSSSSGGGAATAANASTMISTYASVMIPWWLKDSRNIYCVICLLGPILLREIISTIWVISDVLILYHSSKVESTQPPLLLKMGKKTVDVLMSILVTASSWRNANPIMKQRILASLVSKVSLGLEVGTGCIILIDAIRAFLDFSTSSVETRPSMIGVGKRLLCARLYFHFMLVRRRKVIDLVHTIRGGFMYVPVRVLDTLLEPKKVMGLDWEESNVLQKSKNHKGGILSNDDKSDNGNGVPSSWTEWIGFLTGL